MAQMSDAPRKRIGFLSFGHWQEAEWSHTPTAREALVQTVELAVAAEELGIDGAFVRVHHFARQLSATFPLLSAIGVRTSRIEIGTAVIDMRYENPLYMAEEAAVADLLSGGRLQLGDQPRLAGAGVPRLRGVRIRRPRARATATSAREDRALPRGDRRRRRRARGRRAARRRPGCCRPAAVAGTVRPHLVGLRLAGDRGVGG